MIYTITLNPALDYVVRLPGTLKEGSVNRAEAAEVQFGGKGINVSLVLKELGISSTALGFTAGHTGAWLEQGLRQRGLCTEFIRLPEGETRINVKLKAGKETDVNAPGPAISPEAMEQLLARIGRLAKGDLLVLAGSVPAGLAPDIYEKLLAQAERCGAHGVVDAEGALLEQALPHRPFLIKPNRDELSGLFGYPIETDAEIEACAAALQQNGARNVLVSLGGDGALLCDETGRTYRRAAPKGRAVNTVGAGDSMVAGFLAGWMQTHSYEKALLWGTAAGATTAFSLGLADGGSIRKLAEQLNKA
jgi:1-phosphofructokinase